MHQKDHLPALDGLRALAILLVIWVHIPGEVLGRSMAFARATVLPGYLGVDIFFVLSGFLITRILLADRARGKPLRSFLLRRMVRIFPIYYLLLLIVAFWRGGPELPWCFAYLGNFYFPFHEGGGPLEHTWSLAVEEHFYLVWPVLVYLLPRRVSAAIAFCLPALAVAAAEYARRRYEPAISLDLIYMATPFRMASLALGASLAHGEGLLRRHPRLMQGLALLLIAGGEYLIQQWIVGIRYPQWPVMRLLLFLPVSGGIVLGGIALQQSRGPLARTLGCSPLRFVGRISYGLYLYHVPLFALTFRRLGAGGGAVAVALTATLVIATISFYGVERPLLRRVRRSAA